MLTRRQFLERTIQGVSASAAIAASQSWGAGQLAWSKPIGLEIYTVRDEFAKDPAGTLKKVGATGYREVEISTEIPAATFRGYLHDANLTAPSTYIDAPKDIESWKKTLDHAHPYGFSYIVVGDNPQLDADAWKRRAALFNECGRLAQEAGMQFCYHAHFHEFARVDDTSGYDIMLTLCDPELLKMEMDIFWATYAGQDPLAYFQKYPGRFPLLHIKDFKPGFPTSTASFPYDSGPNPFASVGQGRIDWVKIFAHAPQAGTEHIFVEQDRCDGSPFEAIAISFNYLKNLRLS
ncbi:MAG TPA: sugar phosphate isomerase/epimerase [Terriglobia bacterium]